MGNGAATNVSTRAHPRLYLQPAFSRLTAMGGRSAETIADDWLRTRPVGFRASVHQWALLSLPPAFDNSSLMIFSKTAAG
jgi:hypothetical protein